MARMKRPITRIFTLARTFTDVEHAHAFLRGSVRMQTIGYFRQCEHTDKALRGDAYEGLSAIFQPAHIGELVIAGVPIPPTALGGAIKLHREDAKSWHVFCMHLIGCTPEDPVEFDSLEAMRRVLLLSDRSTQLGKHVVYFTKPDEFLRRLHAGIRDMGFGAQSRPVRYFDELLFTGFVDESDVPFRKPKRFAYQKEYRVVAKTPKGVSTPLVVELGDISDLAQLTTAEEFNDSLTLAVKENPKPETCRHSDLREYCERDCDSCGHPCGAHFNSDKCDECDCPGWTETDPPPAVDT